MKAVYFAIAGLATIAFAAPASDTVNTSEVDNGEWEVVPGPGLPSLESLGLTSAELRDPDFLSKNGLEDNLIEDLELEAAMFPPQCQPRYFVPAPIAQARSCRNYLKKLGTKPCKVTGPGNPTTAQTVFCRAGVTQIYGHAAPGTSSYCKHVAIGATWTIDNCAKNGRVAGLAAAYGNGDLQVAVQKIP
ncbi:hypothetical protein CNMCM5793_006838 [Aspergillus hiratsukae]|uniref:Uncharacterized protein n=1 Tax=Aspergillus hiratsukae TaxID=1194566 RepID=A0A8H6PHQ8_9EURO|nr:hypothetical protein CNMCM5793_006838 [Aspergillus hiratsukae]